MNDVCPRCRTVRDLVVKTEIVQKKNIRGRTAPIFINNHYCSVCCTFIKSDETILGRIQFKESLPSIREYWDLFLTTGWNEEYHFTARELGRAIRKSWFSNSIYCGNRLIGFGRVISDGVHHALIVDLIIHPDFQGKGLGKMLLGKLIDQCRKHRIRDIQLFAAKDKFEFYERFGFEKRPVNAPGMQYKYK